MAFVGTFPDGEFKRWLHYQVYTVSFQILGGVLSAVITYHNPENKPSQSGICVANHTSPIDVLVLACDNAYALVSYSERVNGVKRLEINMEILNTDRPDSLWPLGELPEHVVKSLSAHLVSAIRSQRSNSRGKKVS